ncbi:pilus assembly FimT family protein [Hyalangium rubrum]|uniref:Type II secretion system protein n=1 Tax=Hyalangium rubrum TaxID=3103134 RepID=A0ABU5H3G8_9BACT|nr:type II secretion system protein [Hyalangium sp. s54d21]MDY7227649.1 type II secretion system protein [Hyalangium sp. s54d21]
MLARTRLRRGFTLLELMTAVAIIAILAGLSFTAMSYGTGRARVNNAMFDVAAIFSAAQLRAMSNGVPHLVVLSQDPTPPDPSEPRHVRITLLERPDTATPTIDDAGWNTLDLINGPDVALSFERTLPDGTVGLAPAPVRDRLVLTAGSGPDSGGFSFLDLDSPRIRRPLPRPFNTIPLSTPDYNPSDTSQPTRELLGGCSFCVANGSRTYGIIRFNADGTVEVLTGQPNSTGGTIAFMPNTTDEAGFIPRLLTIAAPAGAIRTF